MHSMMENCVDIKDFDSFVVSESDCWDIRKVTYTSGSGGYAQNFYVNDEGIQQNYGYFLNNRSWDTSGTNYGSANIGGRIYFVGNLAFDSPYGSGLSSSSGGGARHYTLNTIDNVRDGISLYTAGDPVRFVSGNLVSRALRYAAFLSASYSNIDAMDFNFYTGRNQFAWGSNKTPTTGNLIEFQSVTGADLNGREDVDASFANYLSAEYSINAASEIIDIIPLEPTESAMPTITDIQADLGIALYDRFGIGRPANNAFDAGASERP